MYKQVLVVVVFVLSTVQIHGAAIDDALLELEELRSLVEGRIEDAHSRQDALQRDFLFYATDTDQDARQILEESNKRFEDKVNSFVDLAVAAGKDPSGCTASRLIVLELLLQDHRTTVTACIAYQNDETVRVLRNARYLIDVTINKVHDIEFQLNRCGDEDLSCVAPLQSEIGLDMVRIPENIASQMSALETVVTQFRINVGGCALIRTSQYEEEGGVIVESVESCINRLLESRDNIQ